MRIAYAGTPPFAVPALEALLDAGHSIVGVWTQPDRPAGRGLETQPSAVKQCALRRGLEVHQPQTLKTPDALDALRASGAQAMVVAAYGLLFPMEALDLFPTGALNIHASLLPRWRGAAPIQRALLAGDTQTGVCIMRMEAGLDTGAVYLRESIPIEPQDTSASLHDKLALLGARLVVATLAELAAGKASAEPQAEAGVTYATKIDKREAQIDWNQSAASIERQIRAFNPVPGAGSTLCEAPLKIWQAQAEQEGTGPAGALIALDPPTVACGSGALRLIEVQRAGGKRMPAQTFVRGAQLQLGERLG